MGRSCIISSGFSSSTILSNQSVEIPASSGAPVESRAGDILVLAAFWTIAYQLVLIARWPARSIVWFFFAFAASGLVFTVRLWRRTNILPSWIYRFHPSHLPLLLLAVGCATAQLFMLRPNQIDPTQLTQMAQARLLIPTGRTMLEH